MVATHFTQTRLGAALAALTLVAMAGCASAPSMNYYTLDMRPSGGAAMPFRVEIARMRVAEPLEGRNILIQKSPTEIEYYAVDRWAAGLNDLVQEKLEAEWNGHPSDEAPQLIAEGIIQGFGQEDQDGGPAAYLKITMEFRSPDASRYDTPLLHKTYEFRQSAEGQGASGVVNALSVCVEQLAAAIAEDATALGKKN